MTKLVWGEIDSKNFEIGVDRGVLYLQNNLGVSWSGLISITDSPSDVDNNFHYMDGVKYRIQKGPIGYSATLEAFSYPPEFEFYEGLSDKLTSQSRKKFNLSYRTMGDKGYKIHLVYNALASPSERENNTLNQTPEILTFIWGLSTTPVLIKDEMYGSHLIIDSNIAYEWALQELEDILYGTDDTSPRFPTISEVLNLFENASIVKVTDHGDGTFTVEGPDEYVYLTAPTEFEVNWPSAVYIDDVTYQISSL